MRRIEKMPGIRQIQAFAVGAEGWWFDFVHRVRTTGYASVKSLTLVGKTDYGGDYLPVRPSVARMALDDLPIADYSEYTFVDLGSGKGRMMLVASEYPFRRIQGVEFAVELYKQGLENIARYRPGKSRSGRPLESLNLDAIDYEFPHENLIVYIFNPFGPDVLQKVLSNLDASIEQYPRDVFLMAVYPTFTSQVEAMPRFQILKRTKRYHIYRAALRAVDAEHEPSRV